MNKHTPRKRFGQNFLQDKNIIEKIIQAINPKQDEHLVEIGPGQGAITGYLIPKCKSLNIIEIDRDLASALAKEYAVFSHVTLTNIDALEFDFSTISHNFRVVGNLPYNISTPLLINFIQYYEKIIDAHFMLQKELVERICAPAGTKTYGRLSVVMQYYFKTEHLFNVPPNCFYPAPKVDSAIIRLEKKHIETPAKDLKLFNQVCAVAFSKRRKTLRNNLKDLISTQEIQNLEETFDLSRRAETLSLEEFIHLTNTIHSIQGS